MRKDRRKEKKYGMVNIIKVFIFLAFILCIFKVAPNYVRNIKQNDTIGLIINNNDVTSKLKYSLWINDKNVLYMSKTDIQNYLDKYIYLDKTNDQIITTYGEKVAVISLKENKITINGTSLNLLSGAEEKEGEYFLPISQMSTVYNMEYTYVKEEKKFIMDSLDRKLIKGTVSKKTRVKAKEVYLSGTKEVLKKADSVVVISKNGKWTKVRTEKGNIGYIPTNTIQNEVVVRNNLTTEKQTSKINMVWDYYSEYVTAPDRTGTTIEGINVVSPSFFSLVKKGKGEIHTNIGTSGLQYIKWAKEKNYKVWAMFSNNSYKETTSEILNSYKLRQNVINKIVNLVNQYELDGINLDFENMNTSDKDAFSRFVIELKPRLQEAGATLSVDVTALDGGDDWSESYDRNVIGDVVDYIVLMAYDQKNASSKTAGTIAGYNWIETNVRKMIDREEIASNKIILGIPFYTRLWKETNGKLTSQTVNMKDISKVLPSKVDQTWLDDVKQNYVEYKKGNTTYKMWLEDEESMKAKLNLVKTYKLAGIAAWEKDREPDSIWKVINESLNS